MAGLAIALGLLLAILLCGCKALTETFSQRLTHWKMLGDDALQDPVKAVGGDALVFVPRDPDRPLNRQQLKAATPETLVSYYSPVFVQQRIDTRAQRVSLPSRVRHDRRGQIEA